MTKPTGNTGVSNDLRGQCSPRTRKWVGNLFPVLESYDYSWAETVELVKSCNYDGNKIQEEVGKIMDLKIGHEQGVWELVGSKNSKSNVRDAGKASPRNQQQQQHNGNHASNSHSVPNVANLKQSRKNNGRQSARHSIGEAGNQQSSHGNIPPPPSATSTSSSNQKQSRLTQNVQLQHQLLKSSKGDVSIDLLSKTTAQTIQKVNNLSLKSNNKPANATPARAGGKGNFTSWAALLKRNKSAQDANAMLKSNNAKGSKSLDASTTSMATKGTVDAKQKASPRVVERKEVVKHQHQQQQPQTQPQPQILAGTGVRGTNVGGAATPSISVVDAGDLTSKVVSTASSVDTRFDGEKPSLQQPHTPVTPASISVPAPAQQYKSIQEKPPVVLPRPLSGNFNPNLMFGCFEDEPSMVKPGASNWDPMLVPKGQTIHSNVGIASNKFVKGVGLPQLHKNVISSSSTTTLASTSHNTLEPPGIAPHFYEVASGANSSYGIPRCNVSTASGGAGAAANNRINQNQLVGSNFSNAFCAGNFGSYNFGAFPTASSNVNINTNRFPQEKYKYPGGGANASVPMGLYQHKDLGHEAAAPASTIPLIYGHTTATAAAADGSNNNDNNERYQDPPGLMGYYPPGHPFFHPGASLYQTELNANVAGPVLGSHLNCGIDPSAWRS